jgi:hypothetical protein
MDEHIDITNISFSFIQEGNTDGTTADYEDLKVDIVGGIEGIQNGSFYYVMRSNSGWSFDSMQELMDTFKVVTKSVQNVFTRVAPFTDA